MICEMSQMLNVQSIRKKFPIVKDKVFLNHAGVSPLSVPVLDSMQVCLKEFSLSGSTTFDLYEGKKLFANLINAGWEEVALVPNTSTGLNIVANILEYPPGANVVVTDLEYPSVVYPWLRRRLGVKVKYVKNVDGRICPEDVEKDVDDNTVAVAVSHVEYSNGFRHDLKSLAQIAHEHGAFLIIDGIQSLGAMEFDVKRDDVDFLATSCYKWLLGPVGAGFLYVRQELIAKFEPPFIGWASMKPEVYKTIDLWNNTELNLSDDCSRFEVGQPSIISYAGVAAALQMILNVGIRNIQKRIMNLTDYLIEDLKDLGLRLQTPEDRECRSGIVNFKIEDPEKTVAKMSESNIIISARAKGIRVSPHFYNTKDEIANFVETLCRIGKVAA